VNDADRYRLPGRYQTPRFRYGRTVWCAVRGEVEVVGLHEAPILWPVGKRTRAKSLIVFKGLARAVRRESEVEPPPRRRGAGGAASGHRSRPRAGGRRGAAEGAGEVR
jgi:hypothetical protein